MNVRLIIRIVWGSAFLFCISGCGKQKDLFGIAFNPERAKRGIKEIPAGWIRDVNRQGKDEEFYVSPGVMVPTAAHRGFKCVWTSGGIDHQEEDTFYSGRSKKYTDADDRTEDAPEALIVIYSFDDERAGKNPWWIDYYEAGNKTGLRDPLTREEANAKLREWGLPPI